MSINSVCCQCVFFLPDLSFHFHNGVLWWLKFSTLMQWAYHQFFPLWLDLCVLLRDIFPPPGPEDTSLHHLQALLLPFAFRTLRHLEWMLIISRRGCTTSFFFPMRVLSLHHFKKKIYPFSQYSIMQVLSNIRCLYIQGTTSGFYSSLSILSPWSTCTAQSKLIYIYNRSCFPAGTFSLFSYSWPFALS